MLRVSGPPAQCCARICNCNVSKLNISYSCKGIRTLISLFSLPFVFIKRKKGGLPNSITELIPVYFTGILCFCFIQPVNVRQKQFASTTQDIIQCSQLPQSEITEHFVHRKNDYKPWIKLQAGCSHPANFHPSAQDCTF